MYQVKVKYSGGTPPSNISRYQLLQDALDEANKVLTFNAPDLLYVKISVLKAN